MVKVRTLFKIRNLYLFSLILIATGLSVSKPLIVLGQLCLLALWIFTGDYKTKLKRFANNRVAVILCLVLGLSLLGLSYTSNFDYAFGDIRRKLHLALLPFFIGSFPPLSKKEVLLLFKTYVFWVVFSSLWSVVVMLGGIQEEILDKRQLSRFNSHIRFGLEVCMAIFGSIYFYFQPPRNKLSLLWLLVVMWLVVFLFLLGMFTGIVVLFATAIILLLAHSIRSKNRLYKFTSLTIFVILVSLTFFTIKGNVSSFYETKDVKELPLLSVTEEGEEYVHDTTGVRRNDKENGYYIWRNIAWGEVKAEWSKRSELDFYGYDRKGQILTTTLIRFLTSKGVVKNAESVQQLSNEEVNAIEKGVSNVNYLTKNAVDKRLNKIIWEFDNYQMGRDYNGHSVVMRWEYLKTAYRIFKSNFWLGVGTGDVQEAFDYQYKKDNTILNEKYQLRAHNQYATYAVSFGVFGLVGFLVFLFYPICYLRMYKNYLYLAFFSIAILSMFTEDTLETQVGIVFFAFFNSILLLKEREIKS